MSARKCIQLIFLREGTVAIVYFQKFRMYENIYLLLFYITVTLGCVPFIE